MRHDNSIFVSTQIIFLNHLKAHMYVLVALPVSFRLAKRNFIFAYIRTKITSNIFFCVT